MGSFGLRANSKVESLSEATLATSFSFIQKKTPVQAPLLLAIAAEWHRDGGTVYLWLHRSKPTY